jgi:hypothetical protein
MIQSQRIIISKDVIFEEDKHWNWDNKFDAAILYDLEWGEDDEVQTESNESGESEHDPGANTKNSPSTGNSPSTSSTKVEEGQEGSLISTERRNRSEPFWMRDYETG